MADVAETLAATVEEFQSPLPPLAIPHRDFDCPGCREVCYMPTLLTPFDYTCAHCGERIITLPADDFSSVKPATTQVDWRKAHSVYPFGGTAGGA